MNEIPDIRTDYYAEQWEVTTEVEISGKVKEIELYFGFQESFPYTLPDVYFPSKQFGYLPHIESQGGKLCLIADGASYQINNPYKLIRYCLKESKILIEQGANGINVDDFNTEINSYWKRRYDDEPKVSEHWLIYESFPIETCTLRALLYKQELLCEERSKTIIRGLLLSQNEKKTSIERYLKRHHKVEEMDVLFVKSAHVPHKAPYCLSLQNLLDNTSSAEDCKAIKRYINTFRGGIIVFQLSETSMGGIYIDKVNTVRKGFRVDKLTACDILLRFEKKNQALEREYGDLYSSYRIAMRTAGEEMPKQSFMIAGLGSIGSNLTYFLSGWNNTSFTLIDEDSLRAENIGRHLLGFQYLYQNKANAVADYLFSIRPERDVRIYDYDFRRVFKDNNGTLNAHTALFLCTGDAMTEKFVVDALRDGHITLPTFILWLEPFGIAGHLIYINPMQMPKNFTLYKDENSMLYKYNLLAPTEYIEHPDRFTKKDAGCNGEYSLYSGNDVVLFLSAFYSHINQLIQQPKQSKCYRWVGNINLAIEKSLELTVETSSVIPGNVQELPL
ncbi:E2/UBC family protein [Bacteroides sp. UBA939]|uniref:E2/UBC family protein n=1 Tax=Bacteroides sp. UBA939 TaxID=1946092 RepID=UPI0025BE2571|nr:E2/UBC family protein [Bacteroides sp. UBA939]